MSDFIWINAALSMVPAEFITHYIEPKIKSRYKKRLHRYAAIFLVEAVNFAVVFLLLLWIFDWNTDL